MSLSDIGNIIKQINKLKKFDTWEEAADKAGDICQKLAENLTEMPEMANKVRKELSFSDEILDIADISDAIENVSDAASDGTSVVSKFGSSLKGAFSSIGGTIAAHPIIATIAAITAAIAIRAAVVEDATEKMDKALQSQSEHKDTLSEIDSINSELETTQQRIDELNAKENLSFVEKAELSDLQTANAELEKQLELKERLARKQAIQAAEDAKDAINTRSEQKAADTGRDDFSSKITDIGAKMSDTLGIDYNGGIIGLVTGNSELISDGDNLYEILSDKIDQLNEAETELKRLEESVSENDNDILKSQKESAIEKQEEKVRGLESVVARQYSDLEQLASTFYYEDENGLIKVYDECLEDAKQFEMIQEKYLATGSSEAKAIDTEKAIEGVFSKVKFDGIKEKFVELGQVGRASLEEELSSGNYESLIETISNALGIDEGKAKSMLSDYIMSIADPDALKIDEIKEQLRSAFSDDEYEINLRAGENADRVWEEWTKDMSDEDWEILYSIKQENDTSTWEIEDWENAFDNAKYSADAFLESIDSLKTSVEDFSAYQTNVNEALSASVGATGLTTEQIDNLTNAYKDLEGYDASKLFEETANGVHLNAEELEKLNEQYASNQTAKYAEHIKEIQSAIYSERAKGNDTSALESELEYTQLLQNQYEGLTSSYNKWLKAKSGENERDSYESIASAYEEMKETLSQGWYGDESLNAYLDLVLSATQRTGDAEKDFAKLNETISGTSHSIMDYWRYDDDDNLVTDGLFDFLDDVNKKFGDTYASIDEQGKYSFDFTGGKLQEVADAFGMSVEMVEMFERAMIDANMDVDMIDLTQVDKSIEKLKQFQEAGKISGSLDLDFDIDMDRLEDVKYSIDELKEERLKIDAETDPELAKELDELIAKCEEKYYFRLDAETDGGLSSAVQIVKEMKSLTAAPLTVETRVNNEDEITALATQLAELPTEVQTAVGIKTENLGDFQGIISQLNSNPSSINVPVGFEPDTSDADTAITNVENSVIHDKEFDITVNDRASSIISSIKSNLSGLTNRTITVTTLKQTIESNPTKATGTAYSNGTVMSLWNNYRASIGAYATGNDWALPHNENALVNELGTESIVRDGKWFTIPGGAHIEQLKKGDIIFSAAQTEELIRTGRVISGGGHGKVAHADGTAYNTLNLKAYNGGYGSGGGRRTNSGQSTALYGSSSSSSSSTKSTDANTTAVETNTETIEEVSENLKDWAEIYVDRIIDSLSKFKDTIDRLEVARNQNASINGYIKEATDAIGHLQSTANYYLQKANSLGISSDYVNKIKNGQINIQDISDENLKEKIEKFQEWYEKAKDITDQIEDLNIEINELKVQKLDNLFDDYDNLVGFHKSLSGINDVYSELAEKMTGVGNLGNLLNNLNQNKQIKAYYEAEAKELQTMLDALVADGAIGLHSDTWLEWASNIAEVKQQIVECDMELWEMKDAIREVRLKDFTDSIENLEHANDVLSSIRDLMSEEGIFDRDTIAITDLGYAQLGIMSQELVNAKQQVANYNTAIEALDKDLENGNITQNDYNELLKEYEKSQMDAVSAVKSYKDAIIDVIKNGIEKETEAMEELISKRKEDLDMQKEYYDFQKEMSDKSSEINRIKAQISAISGSDSLEDKQRLRSLQSQLKQLQDEYNETLKERQFDLVQDAYDKTSEQIQENKEDVLYELETDLEAQNKAIASVLQSVQDNYTSVYEELNILSKEYGYEMSESLTKPWEDAQNALNNYLESVGKINSNVSVNTDKIESNYNAATSASTVGSEAKINQQKATTTTTSTSNVNSYSAKASQIGQILQRGMVHSDVGILQSALKHMGYYNGNIDNDFGDQTYAALRQFQTDAKASGQYNDAIDGILGTNTKKALGLRGYYTGTTNAKSGWALLDDTKEGLLDFGSELVIADDGSIVTPYGRLKKLDGGEVILNKLQTQKLVDMVNSNFIQPTLPKLPEMKIEQRGGDVNIHYDNIIGKIDHVDKNVLPDLQTIIERSAQYTIKTLNKYSKR